MARADDITNQFLGQPIEVSDPNNPYQCMDWAAKYCEMIGVPYAAIRRALAIQVWTQPTAESRKYFDYVTNTPAYIAPAGALAIFSPNHIALVLSGCTRTMLYTSDQNWNGVKRIQRVTHANYVDVVGFLVPKTATVTAVVVTNGGVYEAVRPAAVRIAPYLNANLGGSKLLQPGARFVAKRVVGGGVVSGNGQWVQSQYGNYVWSGNLKKVG